MDAVSETGLLIFVVDMIKVVTMVTKADFLNSVN